MLKILTFLHDVLARLFGHRPAGFWCVERRMRLFCSVAGRGEHVVLGARGGVAAVFAVALLVVTYFRGLRWQREQERRRCDDLLSRTTR